MIKPKKTLENIEPYEVELFAQPLVMKLDANENYLGPSPKVQERLKNLEIKDICHYPYYGSLYEKIASLNNVNAENIAITNGADESLSAVINTYLTSVDTILTVKPSFSMPKIYAGIIGATYKEVPYEKKWVFPEETFIKNIDDTVKIILITSPNNPTGDLISAEYIEKILNLHKDKLLLVDETYSTYAEHTCAHLIKRYDNLAVIRSLSKDYALAGLRIGYVLSCAGNINNIKKVLSPYTVNNVAAIAATEAICDEKYINFVKEEIKKSRTYLEKEFTKMGANVYKSNTNFVLADFGSSAQTVSTILKNRGISVKTFSDPALKNSLRITVPSYNAAQKIISLLNPKDTIVFDMDGVLVDVSDSYRLAIQKTYEKFCNKSLSLSAIQSAKNMGGMNNDWDLTHYLIKNEGFDIEYSHVVEEFQKIYWNEGAGAINNEKLLIQPNVLEKLAQKYSMALFTGRPKAEAEYTLEKFQLSNYFSKTITMDDLPADKQKPDTLGLDLINKVLPGANVFYLGDTVDDMKCAKDFGAQGVGILPPSDKSDGLKDLLYVCGAKYVINDVNCISDLLESFEEVENINANS